LKLRPRLTLFNISLVLIVIVATGIFTAISLRYFLLQEMKADQMTWFNNFKKACLRAEYLDDDLAVRSFSESLEQSVPELSYAVYVDHYRPGIRLGGVNSLQRFEELPPSCPDENVQSASREPFLEDVATSNQRLRYYCQQVRQTNAQGYNAKGTVYVGFNMRILDAKLRQLTRRMLVPLTWTLLVVLALGAMGSMLLARKMTRPIRHLTEGAQAIGEGNLDTRIPIESSDELGFLAHEFNLMATKLKELDQLKDDFVSAVSHELRSPLSAISGYVELLRSKPLEKITAEKREKALGIIQESTNRLTHFINEILDLTKLKAGQVEVHYRPFDVEEAVEEVVGLFQPLLEKKSLEWRIDVPPDMPVIPADAEKIRQILTNLISNALKFTPSGGTIRIWARNHIEFIQISVQDTGVGIPSEAKEAVFERFRQVKGAKEHAGQKGTGLGLAIAKGNVEVHGGRIWIESEFGEGTTVHFTLPVRPQEGSDEGV